VGVTTQGEMHVQSLPQTLLRRDEVASSTSQCRRRSARSEPDPWSDRSVVRVVAVSSRGAKTPVPHTHQTPQCRSSDENVDAPEILYKRGFRHRITLDHCPEPNRGMTPCTDQSSISLNRPAVCLSCAVLCLPTVSHRLLISIGRTDPRPVPRHCRSQQHFASMKGT
jgi:hypothetical protein